MEFIKITQNPLTPEVEIINHKNRLGIKIQSVALPSERQLYVIKRESQVMDWLQNKIHNVNTNLITIDRFLTLEEMHEIITCFDLVLLPYRNSHFGIASMLLRAMACNRPALVSKYGWLEKMAEKFDSIYSFEGEEDFIHQIKNIEDMTFNNHNYNNKEFAKYYTEKSIEDFINSWI